MAIQPEQPRRFGLQWRLTLLFLTLALLVSSTTSIALYRVASEQVRADLRQRLGDIVSVAAKSLDANRLASITPALGMDSDAFRRMRADLQAIRDSATDLKYVYTLRLGPDGLIHFVVDAEDDPADALELNLLYGDASPLLRERFADLTDTLVETDFYTDQWGTFLSGYAPIRRPDGSLVGVLGADMTATRVRTHERQVLWIAVGLFVGTLPLIVFGGWWVGRTMARPIAILNQGALQIAEGDLSVRLGFDRRDEIGALADSFDHMAGQLKDGRRRLEDAAIKYRSIFDNAAEGIFQTTADGQLVTANPAALRMLGYHNIELAPHTVVDLGSQIYANPHDRQRLLATLHEQGSVQGFEVQLKRANGATIWVEVSLHRVRASGAELLEGMFVDITDRRRRQEAEREREAARAANEAKSEFLANMSHEIRTPMNAVLGLAYLLSQQELPGDAQQLARQIHESGQSLLGIINDILDLSKIEAGKIELERLPFRLTDLLEQLAPLMATAVRDKRGALKLLISPPENGDPALLGDALRLKQVLINLTNNAIKFTDSGLVELRIQALETSASQLRLRFVVRDTGIGIDQATQARLFQPFTQGDASTTRRFGGTGLGLVIVRRLVTLMGGTLGLESVVGAGSTFWFELPFAITHADAVPARSAVAMQVLVVTDDPTAGAALLATAATLRWRGHLTSSGEEALALVRDHPSWQGPNAAVLLGQLLGPCGLSAAKAIRAAIPESKWPLLFALTPHLADQVKESRGNAMVDAVLAEPLTPSPLYDAVVRARQRRSGAQAPLPAHNIAKRLATVRLLVVDDTEINREVARRVLTNAGAEVSLASNGQEALDWLLAHPGSVDAVLMDVQMPVMDGLEATRRIRQCPDIATLPVIALTAGAMPAQQAAAHDAGMNGFLSKPLDVEQTLALILRLTGDVAATPEPPAVTTDKELPGLNIRYGLSLWQDPAIYRRYLRQLADDWRDASARLATAGPADARQLAHALKGVAGNLGLTDVCAQAGTLERQLAAGDPAEQIETTQDSLHAALQTAFNSIARYGA